jgi:hypothetical protein
MATQASLRDAPPQAPVTIAVAGYAALLGGRSAAVDPAARRRFVRWSLNEETLAAEYALLSARPSADVAAAGLAVLTAAVALRPYAQERAWLRGDPAPTARDLQVRYGVAITYDSTARASWRPFLQRSLEVAIEDMRRVLPGFDPRGLRVHFGASPAGDRALAMHDPIRRTIYFPAVSSSGVMAHEFAHDLDWQAARREYGATGWYRTDHAARQQADVLAGALRQMASAARVPGSDFRGTTVSRPTEVFARNVDWFISATLARQGRVNGHLSAVQDPVLTGYGSAITPEAARDAGSATLRALDDITPVPAVERDWFTAQFGAERRLSVHEAVRQVLEVPVPPVELDASRARSPWPPEATRALFSGTPAASGAWRCLLDFLPGRGNDAGAVRAVVQYAAEARARGLVRRWQAYARRSPGRAPAELRALTGAPWDPAIESATLREVRDAILWSAVAGGEPDFRNPAQGRSPTLRSAWGC